MCYTVDLSLDKTSVTRSKQEYVEVRVNLGGAASDVTKASVELKGKAGKLLRSSI